VTVPNEREAKVVTCPECGVEVTHLRRHLKKVHPDVVKAAPVAPRKRATRPADNRSGELWAKCPECHVPVKDAELFKHLLNCPGAEVRRSEWAAQQAAEAAAAQTVVQPDVQSEAQPEAQPELQP
jgi:hypothetical protein